jgi:hypothetical protein
MSLPLEDADTCTDYVEETFPSVRTVLLTRCQCRTTRLHQYLEHTQWSRKINEEWEMVWKDVVRILHHYPDISLEVLRKCTKILSQNCQRIGLDSNLTTHLYEFRSLPLDQSAQRNQKRKIKNKERDNNDK